MAGRVRARRSPDAGSQQHTSSDRTLLARMLLKVIGGPGCDRGVLMPWEDTASAGRSESWPGLCCGLNREAAAGPSMGRHGRFRRELPPSLTLVWRLLMNQPVDFI
jgi:hypothetical protein